MQGGEGPDRFYRAVGWTIERAIIDLAARFGYPKSVVERELADYRARMTCWLRARAGM